MLGKQIKAQFSDGKWHSFETIVTKTGVRAKKVWSVLDYMRRWGTYKTKCERKKVGTEYHFRLSPKDKQISVQELIEKLTPILKELEVQGRANAATMSPPTVRIMTAKIQKLLEEWAERPSADRDTAARSPSARPSIGGPDGPFNGYSTACSAATSDNDARLACVAEAQSEADHQRSR
jgi:hypothetical protein